MAYTVNLQCLVCGHRYSVRSDEMRVCPRCVVLDPDDTVGTCGGGMSMTMAQWGVVSPFLRPGEGCLV